MINVSQSAAAISNSLIDTSNVLLGILGLAQAIDGTLEAAERVETCGTALIPIEVQQANSFL